MFSDPIKNLKTLALEEDMLVADLGAGTGFYAIPVAHMVPRGKVYAVEIQQDFLKTIKNKILENKLSNIECIWGDVERPHGTKLKDGIIDVAIVSNIFCHLEDRDKFLTEVKRILKKNARVLLVELEGHSVIASKNHHVFISKDDTIKLFTKFGFALEREIDTGEHHYGMIFRKGSE